MTLRLVLRLIFLSEFPFSPFKLQVPAEKDADVIEEKVHGDN